VVDRETPLEHYMGYEFSKKFKKIQKKFKKNSTKTQKSPRAAASADSRQG
jgi:hypothetical protein